MYDIVSLGINHKTAPIELRERLAFTDDEIAGALEVMKKDPAIKEVILISTCNRMEVLMTAEDVSHVVESVIKFISETKSVPAPQFENAVYIHDGDMAVKHIFMVASSLDSMMVGEPQILGQLKDSYKIATIKKTSGVILNRLLHRAFFVAKRVRSETGIGDRAVSISFAAIELGRKIFGSLEEKKTLLIGAGEMAELAVEHLIRNKATDIIIANRTFERGVELARRFGGKAIKFTEISDYLKYVDIIISSTNSPEFIITRDHMKGIMRARKNQPLFFIDIAVPRDIDPEINRLTNSYVYDIDDFKGIIAENIKNRNKESVKGERIVDEAVINFRRWYDSLEAVPTIVSLKQKIDGIAKKELKKTLHSSLNHLSKDDCQALIRMTNALVNKIMHDPTLFLKSNGCRGKNSVYLDITRKLFKLDG